MDARNLVGATLDSRYEVKRLLGGGGMGCVYEAQHVKTGGRVAVKVISTGDLTKDAALVGRFQREAQAAGKIDTQHICKVFDTGTDPSSGLPFMVMEYMLGEDVQQLLRRVGPIGSDVALRIVAQVCLGLGKAHENGVVHRDIKPANIFLAKSDGGAVVVKVLDFGIAKVKMEHASDMGDAGLTRTGTMLGSPLYMSPEQARGSKSIDHRADVWSLGVVLYEMLCGRTPFHHIEALGELIIAICSEPPRPLQDFAPWVPPEVAAIVHKALKAHPSERYQTAAEMLAAVRELLPHGTAVDETMLTSLSETQRSAVARRLTLPPPGAMPAASIPPPAPVPEEPAVAQAAGTTGGLAAPTEQSPQPPSRSNASLVVIGAAIGIAAAGFVAFKLVGGQEGAAAQPAQVADATTPAETQAPAAAATTQAPAVIPAVAPRTVQVVVLPEDAAVTVDGQPATVKKGYVEITGALGSEHRVKIVAGGKEIEESVTIAEGGPRPPKIELELPKKSGLAGPKPTAQPGAPPGPAPPKAPGPGIEEKFE